MDALNLIEAFAAGAFAGVALTAAFITKWDGDR